ncbi:MAG: ABC transporter ATP-binding protein [Coriobacteriales bacterium]|jgi:ATP-binding cassette subfamily B protein|nr:ABC transporter ATP-binding protein [Coriobacteriales bacterium]
MVPFLGAVCLAVVLLFVQAICDLNLPNLMSDIVNTGIQKGGVEEVAPRAISKEGHDFIEDFMSDEDRGLLEQSYHLSSDAKTAADGAAAGADERGGSAAGDRPLSDTWPKAASEPVYLLTSDISAQNLTQLDAAFGKAAWTLLGLLQRAQQTGIEGGAPALSGDASGAPAPDLQQPDLQQPDLQQIDLSVLYQLQPLLQQLPEQWHRDAARQAEGIDPALRGQSATLLTAAFYRELGRDMGAIEMSYILRIGLIMLLVTALSGLATVLVGFISARVGAGVARDLRAAVFEKVSRFSHAEFDRFSTASLITRSTNDVTVMQMLVTLGIRMICYAPIMGIGATAMALSKSVAMSWLIGLAVVLLLGIIGVLAAIVMPKFQIMQTLVDRVNLVARESLVGLMVVRAFSRSDFERKRFDAANRDLTRTTLFVNRAMTFMMPTLMLLMNGLTALVIWVGSQQVAASQMQVGDMMAYMQYVMQIITSFMFIAMIFVFLPRAQVSAKRIAEVLQTEPTVLDPPKPALMDESRRGEVEFRDVSFRYQGGETDALQSISFIARPGQTTAFIGSTGSGKSTILNLIPRFYDVTAGAVLVGGVDVRTLSQHELRAHIGYVPQQSVLMAGTVASNIAYGAPEADVAKIAAVAQAEDFIEALPEGFDAPVSQGGSNVSGGQRQRISIARALAINPDIYLFDDSFSALDFATDAALRRALAAYTANATLIIVAQRVNTIRDADQIYVIDDGRIVGQGRHEELLESCEAYAQIAHSQLAAPAAGAPTAPAAAAPAGDSDE